MDSKKHWFTFPAQLFLLSYQAWGSRLHTFFSALLYSSISYANPTNIAERQIIIFFTDLREDTLYKDLPTAIKYLLNFGKSLIDKSVIGILGENKITNEFRESDKLFDLLKEGRGLILMMAHVGCWQAAMSALRFLKTPVHLLLLHEEGDIDRHYFEHAGIAFPYNIIDPTGYLGGVLEMMQVLRAGEVLCVMGDRLLGGKKGSLAVDFLGGKTHFPISTFKIASVTGAPIVTMNSYKSGPSGYTLEISGIIRVPAEAGKHEQDLVPYVREFALTLESFTTAHPL